MSKRTEYYFLILLVFATILPKWIISIIYFDNSIIVNTIFNVEDIQYFPIIISVSDLIFNPSYLDSVIAEKFITFPIYSVFFHSIFFKIFGIYSFLILEFLLKFIFLIILLKMLKKIFENLSNSLNFCLLLFFFISLLQITISYGNFRYLELLFYVLNENLGSRTPRPLITGIVYFYFFLTLYSFKENLQKNNLNFFILISFLLSLFLNSFFYYFINFSILIIFLLFKYLDISILKFFNKNKIKILAVLVSFIIFSSPFFLQLYLGENDYSERIGMIELNLQQKLYLLKYYFINLLRLEFVILLISSLTTYYYLNKNFYDFKNQISKLNIFFYFFLISIISPPIFFFISPKLISIYHFLGVLIFISIFYLLLSFYFILNKKFKLKEKNNNKNLFKIILVFIIIIINMHIAKINIIKNEQQVNEVQNIQKFLEDKNLIQSKQKLFTNDLRIMNLWLLNNNNELTISDGFVNSLKNSQIEFNLISNLKNFGISDKSFKELISYGKPEIRNHFLMRIFAYKYQANSLYTFTELDSYHKKLLPIIESTSPFRVQLQIFPETEKERFYKYFQNVKLKKNLFSDIIIINKSDSFKNFSISNKNYELLLSLNLYDVYLKKN
jgi:hypothetical protein